MRKNKKLNKITSGALVIMLASGGLFSNSHASEEKPINNSALIEKENTSKTDKNEKKNNKPKSDEKEKLKDEKNIEDIKLSSDNSVVEKENKEDDTNKTINDVVENQDDSKENVIKKSEIQPKSEDTENKNIIEVEKEDVRSDATGESNNNKEAIIENNPTTTNNSQLNNNEIIEENNTHNDNAIELKENNNEKENTNIETENKQVNESKKTTYINDYNSKDEFIKMLASHKDLAKEHHIFPSVMMGQAILESGYGQSGLVKNSKNIFGVKGKGDLYNTKEEINGKLVDVKDEFRRFNTYEESIRQYLDLLNSPHYSKFGVNKATNYKEQIQRIKNAGYATASNYVDAVLGVIDYNNLTQYDKDDSNIQNENDGKSIIEQSKKEDIKKDNKSSNVTPSIINDKEIESNKTKDNRNKTDNVATRKSKNNNLKETEQKNQIINKTEEDNDLKEKENKTEKTKSINENALGKEQDNKKDGKNISAKDNIKDKREQKAAKDFIENIALAKTPINNSTKIKTVNKNYSQIDSSANVKTGVGSLSTTLLTLSSATAGLFVNRKRK